ncbi:MAG: hypothetical protein IKR57_05390 [Bacilli bacterium]|nr:hypothetical protein [Bacilli bacterium]
MSYLVGIAVAAAVAKKQRKYYRHSSSRKRKTESSSTSSYHYDPKHSYMDCVLQELYDEESELYKFFKMLSDEYNSELAGQMQVVNGKIDDLESKLKSLTPSMDKLVKKLSKKGINLKYSVDGNNYLYTYIYINNNECIEVNGKTIEEVFDKIKEILKREESKRESEKESIDNNKTHIAEMKKKLKYSIFKRKEIEDDINESSKELQTSIDSYEDLSNTIKVYDEFLKMDEEEKELFKSGLSELQELLKLKEEISKLKNELNKIRHLKDYSFSKEVMDKVMERLLVEGKITSTTLEKVFLMLDRVEIKGRRGDYKFYYTHCQCNESIVRWFVKDIYENDEGFVERNYYLPEDELEEEAGTTKELIQ